MRRDALASAVGAMDADPVDHRWVERLVGRTPSAELRTACATLRADTEPESAVRIPARVGTAAVLRLAPLVQERLRRREVSPATVARTMTDFGRKLRRHRRVTGRPGLLNWRWFRVHLSGAMIEVGRLQFEVIRCDDELSRTTGEWAARLHIPADSGPLAPEAVDESLANGARELRRAWPEITLTHAVCDSWLLDPFLSAHLPGSNIAAFAGRFTPYALPTDGPTDPPYFLWGRRRMTLPTHDGLTRLEQVVTERIHDGGVWQTGRGTLRLPAG
ncbi:MAG: acyltransferase domain-containing protein [Actinobacteria bacterium]|nr:acyltransferase domain-containing protein [Actinomycetota bacterium]